MPCFSLQDSHARPPGGHPGSALRELPLREAEEDGQVRRWFICIPFGSTPAALWRPGFFSPPRLGSLQGRGRGRGGQRPDPAAERGRGKNTHAESQFVQEVESCKYKSREDQRVEIITDSYSRHTSRQ